MPVTRMIHESHLHYVLGNKVCYLGNKSDVWPRKSTKIAKASMSHVITLIGSQNVYGAAQNVKK